MAVYEKKEECYGCGRCQTVCAADAIRMQEDEEGFLYPVINPEKCTGCGRCKAVCSSMKEKKSREGTYYAVRCLEEKLLQKSTSGGAFSLIAEEILEEGGVLCGACMDETLRVVHRISDDPEKMRKSKYVQSDMCGVYSGLERELSQGKKVLFSGTPCQCQAVREQFAAYGTRLLTAALVCRGVQSPKLWREYLFYLGKENPVDFYDFRAKNSCNDAHTVEYHQGGEVHFVPMGKDRFSRLYTKCLTLRPSCYSCEFCRTDVPFDFTIGDFWGIEKKAPELADGKGTSLVIARGAQAEEIMERIRQRAIVISCQREECLQPALESPAKETILRKLLVKDLNIAGENGHCNMELILKKYGM